jgi:hypothetical protein
MKNLIVSFLLSIVSFVSFGQTFVIEGFEHQEMIAFRNTTVDSVLINPDLVNDISTAKLTFVVDLDKKTCRVYVSDEYLNSCPLIIVQNDDKIISVKLMDGDSDSGIIIKNNQTALLYENGIGMTSVVKINKSIISNY